MTTILAIDPGIRSPGVAVIRNGVLVAAARIMVPAKLSKLGDGERVAAVAALIHGWRSASYNDRAECVGHLGTHDTVIYEWPQIYRATRSKGNPNDLLKTLAVGAAAAALYTHRPGPQVRILTPTPAEWTHGTSKDTKSKTPWETERGRYISRRLSAAERAVVPAQHDAIDAVGLALFAAGRMEPIRVNAGATSG